MKAYQGRQIGSKDDWETPRSLFNPLNNVCRFNLDAAANKDNSLCVSYLTDALSTTWDVNSESGTRVWCNPPFSQKIEFLEAALKYRNLCDLIFCLLPNNARETVWWNDLVVPYADLVINLIGRVNFLDKGTPSSQCNFPSCLVSYRPRLYQVRYGSPTQLYWDWKEEREV